MVGGVARVCREVSAGDVTLGPERKVVQDTAKAVGAEKEQGERNKGKGA